MALAAVFMTAFYMFRVLFMTFGGEFKGGSEADPNATPHDGGVHLAESPAVMVWPLLVLGAASVLAGFLANPLTNLGIVPIHGLVEFLGRGAVHVEIESFNVWLAAASSVIAVAGIWLAYEMYWAKRVSAEHLTERLRPIHTLLFRKYYFDEAYEEYLTRRGFYAGLARTMDWADKSIIDRLANAIGWLGAHLGQALRQTQTGQLQSYGMAISVGILVILGLYLFFI